MDKVTKRILSGVQPSGDLHLGNYLGAIKNFVSLQKEFECFFCVVDLHAIIQTLMAADILIYLATHVPVGDDQKQHLELTRDIAQKFNNDFKTDLFPIPEPLIFGEATRVMSLRDGSKK